jgi:homoserine O-acetyltransferase
LVIAPGPWREGDPPAGRQFADLGPIRFEFGGGLPALRLAYETHGRPRRDASGAITNAVLILHALRTSSVRPGPGSRRRVGGTA